MKLCTFVGAFTLFLVPVTAQGSIMPFLPKDTVLAVSVPDLATSVGDFAKMPLAKMWREEEVQHFLADAKERVNQEIGKLLDQARAMYKEGRFPVDPDKLLNLRLDGGTFALTQLGIAEGEFGPEPKIGLVLHLDFGASAQEWLPLVQMGLGLLEQKAGDKMTKEESKVGDCSVVAFKPNTARGGEMGLNVATVGTGIVVGTLTSEVEAIVENLSKKTPELALTDRYKTNSKFLLSSGAEAEMFMRIDPMLDFLVSGLAIAKKMHADDFEEVDVDGIGRAIDALGLRSILSIGASSTYEGSKAVTKSFAVLEPNPKGLMAGTPKKLDVAFLKWVPKEAVSFSAATMSSGAIYDALVGSLRAYDEKLAERMLSRLGEMEKQLGFTVKDDFFGSIGDEIYSWSMPMSTITSAPEVAVLLKINDQDRIVKVLKGLAALTDGKVEIEEGEKRGVKAFQIRINLDPTQGMGMNPFDVINPTFAFKNGFMVVGLSPSDIKRVFQRMDREDDPKGDIRGNKEFAAVSGALPQGVSSLSFTDWKAQFESFYQIATSLLAFVPMGDDVPIDMSLLPDAATLTKHLFGSVSYSSADPQGWASTTISPFGPEVGIGIVAVAIGAGAAIGLVRRF
jgi:hypothetical protein